MRNRKPPLWRPPHQQTEAERRAAYQKRLDALRGSASARGYDAAWHALRARHIAEHPHCVACAAAGTARRAEIVDHIQPVKVRPDLRLDAGNLRSLCRPCHTRRTADDPTGGGFGRRMGA